MKLFMMVVMMLVLSSCAHKVAIKKDSCECSGNICVCNEV